MSASVPNVSSTLIDRMDSESSFVRLLFETACESYPLDVEEVMLGVPAFCESPVSFALFVLLLMSCDEMNELLPMSLSEPIVFDMGNFDRIGGLYAMRSYSSSGSLQLSSISSASVCLDEGSSCKVVIRRPSFAFPGDAEEMNIENRLASLGSGCGVNAEVKISDFPLKTYAWWLVDASWSSRSNLNSRKSDELHHSRKMLA